MLDGIGLIDLRAVADSASSPTWLWPMLVGGLVVGLGFVTSSYCPGTSVVAMASVISGWFVLRNLKRLNLVGALKAPE